MDGLLGARDLGRCDRTVRRHEVARPGAALGGAFLARQRLRIRVNASELADHEFPQAWRGAGELLDDGAELLAEPEDRGGSDWADQITVHDLDHDPLPRACEASRP